MIRSPRSADFADSPAWNRIVTAGRASGSWLPARPVERPEIARRQAGREADRPDRKTLSHNLRHGYPQFVGPDGQRIGHPPDPAVDRADDGVVKDGRRSRPRPGRHAREGKSDEWRDLHLRPDRLEFETLLLAGPRRGRWKHGFRIEVGFRLRPDEPLGRGRKSAKFAASSAFAPSGHQRLHLVKERGIVSIRDVMAVPQS